MPLSTPLGGLGQLWYLLDCTSTLRVWSLKHDFSLWQFGGSFSPLCRSSVSENVALLCLGSFLFSNFCRLLLPHVVWYWWSHCSLHSGLILPWCHFKGRLMWFAPGLLLGCLSPFHLLSVSFKFFHCFCYTLQSGFVFQAFFFLCVSCFWSSGGHASCSPGTGALVPLALAGRQFAASSFPGRYVGCLPWRSLGVGWFNQGSILCSMAAVCHNLRASGSASLGAL